MGLLDTYLSDSQRSLLQKRRAKISGAFFLLFTSVVVMSYVVQTQLSEEKIATMTSNDVRNLKLTLGGVSVFVLGYLGWILFKLIRPTYITYLDLVTDLLAIKYNLNKSDKPLSARENTLLRFRELNFAVNNAVLYATIAYENRIDYISKNFEDYLGFDEEVINRKFEEVLTYKHNQHHRIRKILSNATKEFQNIEMRLTNHKSEIYWIQMSIFNMAKSKNANRKLIICHDITESKEDSIQRHRLSKMKFDAEVKSQKDLSQQIMVAQEEERKRIAKDIHDGIGQMLTALRFSIDGIDLENKEKSKESLKNLNIIFGQLIKDVRTVTFNLAPPELSDHGLGPALRKMSNVVGEYTGIKVLYENLSDFDRRLPTSIETNVYRVVQEAVNNALKYSLSDYILITLKHKKDTLTIKVKDEGIGFETQKVEKKEGQTANGLRFMKERITFIHGDLSIISKINKGTTVYISIPI